MLNKKDEDSSSPVPALIAVLSAGILLYSIVVTRQLIFGVLVVSTLFGIYLFWRIVIAFERFVTAIEAKTDMSVNKKYSKEDEHDKD